MWLGYWFKNWTLNYKIGYGIVRLGLRTFYNKFEISGLDKIPKNAGVLFAINHQNAFMDPIVLSSQLHKNAYYLARADIFKKKFANKILRSIYMLPIYRQRDGVNTIEKNESTFDECFDVLHNNGCILIFPEGNHNNQKRLRPLKKGISRIGLGAGKKYDYIKPIYVVPVGLDYSNHTNMGANLLINIADPIDLSSYYQTFEKDPNTAITALMSEIQTELESVLLNIKSENYSTYISVIALLKNHFGSKFNLVDNLTEQQKLVAKLEKLEIESSSKFQEIEKLCSSISIFLEENKLRPIHLMLGGSIYIAFLKVLLLMLFLPLHLIGLISNYIPYKIPVLFVEKKVNDPHFHSSIKMSMGVILFILCWSIQTILVSLLFGWKISGIYVISLPMLAMLNYRWLIHFKKTMGLIQSIRLRRHSSFKNAVINYNKFIDLIKN